MNFLAKLFITYVSLIIIFVSLLVLVDLIPSKYLRNNIGSSLGLLKKEGDYSSYGIKWRRVIRDSFTDTLMLNEAYTVNSKEPLKSAMSSYYSGGTYDSGKQTSSLEQLYNGSETRLESYDRYWHGYLTTLRPMLVIFSFQQIRIIFTVTLLLLWCLLLYLIYLKAGLRLAFSFLIGFMFVDFLYIGQSIQFSSVFLISIIGSLYLITKLRIDKTQNLFFFIIGAFTAYFDLLTAPLVTLGVPLAILMYMNSKKYLVILQSSFFWALGYLLSWSSKWILVQWLYSRDSLNVAINQIGVRTVTPVDSHFSQWKTISLNFWQLVGYDKTNKYILLGFGIFMLLILLLNFKRPKNYSHRIFPWLLAGLIPYAWYAVAANHSYMHVWFTYRTQLLTLICATMVYLEFIDANKLRKYLNRFFGWPGSNKPTL